MQRKVLRTLKAAVAFSLAFSLSVPAFAASDKEQAQQTLSALENQKAALEGRLAQLQASKADTESYIAQIDSELTSVYEEIARLTKELEQTETDLAKTRQDLETAKEKEASQYEALKARIRVMYEAGDTTMMEVFMQAEDISSILNAKEYISRISDYDTQLLTQLNETRQEIETLESQLESQKTELENLKAQEESKQEELQMVMDAKQAELGSIDGDIGDAYNSIYTTQQQIEDQNNIIAAIEYQEELDRQAALKAAQEAEAAKQQNNTEKDSQDDDSSSDNSSASDSQNSSDTDSTQDSSAVSDQGNTDNTGNETAGPADSGSAQGDGSTPDDGSAQDGGSTPDDGSAQDGGSTPDNGSAQGGGTTPDNGSAQDNSSVSDNDGQADSNTSDDGSTQDSTSSSSAGVATGSYIWPCAGGYISSGFGGRTSPTAGASSNHKGVDIAAGAGSNIYAADGGTVVTVDYNVARGNYIVVSHGNGMSTLYQHCSAIYASVGQKVSQGDAIAAVGSTGYSTGPHLHFEVWVNGVPVDPSGYIS